MDAFCLIEIVQELDKNEVKPIGIQEMTGNLDYDTDTSKNWIKKMVQDLVKRVTELERAPK